MPDSTRRALSLTFTGLLAVFLIVSVATAPPPAVDRAEAIGSRVKCPVCAGESIADSPAGLARDMMGVVSELVALGYSDQQVIEEVLAAYSGSQLIDPPRSGVTLALWLSPLLFLGFGWWLVASRRRPRSHDGTRTAPTPVGDRP
jgi:cytochrome c-type biogenesis protein CcmH